MNKPGAPPLEELTAAIAKILMKGQKKISLKVLCTRNWGDYVFETGILCLNGPKASNSNPVLSERLQILLNIMYRTQYKRLGRAPLTGMPIFCNRDGSRLTPRHFGETEKTSL